MKFGRYTVGQFVFKFHKNRMGDDISMTSIKFSPNNCPYLIILNSVVPTNFVLGTNTQKYNVHLIIKMTDDKGHSRRSSKKKMN